MTTLPLMNAIKGFAQASTRAGNDAANKLREDCLLCLPVLPASYREDPTYGPQWMALRSAWTALVGTLAARVPLPADTPYTLTQRGGRSYNYDFDLQFHGAVTQKLEFKYGATTINRLPQFLSLQAGAATIMGANPTYDSYFYIHTLPLLCASDTGLTEPRPDWETYRKQVRAVKPPSPFFQQLKDREPIQTVEKHRIVDESIRAYNRTYGPTLDIADFVAKVKATQAGKIYCLWSKGAFYVDEFRPSDTDGLHFHRIHPRGLSIELLSGDGKTTYSLLLRWRNHKGVLNPAWQISVARR